MNEPEVIKGHPEMVLQGEPYWSEGERVRTLRHPIRGEVVSRPMPGRQFRITVCAECERVRTILFLSKDRWLCTSCRNEGDVRPTVIPVSSPRRRI